MSNYDGSNEQYIGIFGGTSANISPNGEWLAWNDDTSDGWQMKLTDCHLTKIITIGGGMDLDFIPEFSPDSKTLYFMRPDPNSEPPVLNAANPTELVAYNLETGELKYITSLYLVNGDVRYFTVNPVTGEVAFISRIVTELPGGSTSQKVTLSIYNPDSGTTQDFSTLPVAAYNNMDYAPDGNDIIFSGNIGKVRGIYRIELTGGSQPILLFTDPSPETVAPLYPHYYADGTRIVWGGQENGTTSSNLWTIDSNGKDMQQLTNVPQTIFLQGVLY